MLASTPSPRHSAITCQQDPSIIVPWNFLLFLQGQCRTVITLCQGCQTHPDLDHEVPPSLHLVVAARVQWQQWGLAVEMGGQGQEQGQQVVVGV